MLPMGCLYTSEQNTMLSSHFDPERLMECKNLIENCLRKCHISSGSGNETTKLKMVFSYFFVWAANLKAK